MVFAVDDEEEAAATAAVGSAVEPATVAEVTFAAALVAKALCSGAVVGVGEGVVVVVGPNAS